jgi:ribonuclease HII
MKLPVRALQPDFSYEDLHEGLVCGLDEVGRGPLAGPVVAACVHIPHALRNLEFVPHIRDSKTLSKQKLENLYACITQNFICSVAEVSPREIDAINILQASLKAMAMAMQATGKSYTHALVDGNRLPKLPCPATAIIKGDRHSVSIAAASIVAKVTRDRLMQALHLEFPVYGWDSNVGYPAPAHLAGIAVHGITQHHRRSFGPVRRFSGCLGPDSIENKNPIKNF